MSLPADAESRLGGVDRLEALPPGRIASVVTYLDSRTPPAEPVPAAPAGWTLDHLPRPASDRYRHLFRRIGEPWLWYSRLRLDEAALRRILDDPAVEVRVLQIDGRDEGLVELDRRSPPDVELAFFGVAPSLIGRGAGRFLMGHALAAAWTGGTERVWVHTCTLDHPGALGFYRKMGFRPYARAVEVTDDPRCDGLLAPDAAPHAPFLVG